MNIKQDVYQEIIEWAQHEFDVSFVIRIAEISWKLFKQSNKDSLGISKDIIEDMARDIIRQIQPPPPMPSIENPWGKGLAEHYALVRKAYAYAVHRYIVNAAYVGLSLPTMQADIRIDLPRPDIFLFTRDGTIWIECEILIGEVSRQVSAIHRKLSTIKRYADYYDSFVFAVPKEAHSYKRADIEYLTKTKETREMRISIAYL